MGIMASSPGDPAAPKGRSVASIASRVRDPGYTPGIRDLGALLELLAGAGDDDDDLIRAVERAVSRIEPQHAVRLVRETVARAQAAVRPARGRLARLVGRVGAAATDEAAAGAAREWLVNAIADHDPKTRHTAARALGKLKPAREAERAKLEAALLAAWDAGSAEDRRALADALGKVGSSAARERLASVARESLPAKRAAIMIDRGAAREKPASIDRTRSAEGATTIRFHSRSGLEEIVRTELGESWRPRVAGPGLVDARLEGPLSKATSIRTATHLGFPLDPIPMRPNEELAEAIVRAILDPRSLAILRAFTDVGAAQGAPIRFRLAWTRGGHRRALAWRCAELVAAATKELVNDPTESTWEIVVDELRDRVALELVPRAFDDDRFSYRGVTVPASSHPTIAAALARLVPPREDEVVWDPFVGAGAELVERARLGPYRALIGTDTEQAAIDAATKNLAAAGIRGAKLVVGDATTYEPGAVTLIVTNPPMGRRVQRGTHGDVLERFLDHAAQVLVPGGYLAWAAPETRLHERAARAGLVLESAVTVDMGGFPAELSVHRKAWV